MGEELVTATEKETVASQGKADNKEVCFKRIKQELVVQKKKKKKGKEERKNFAKGLHAVVSARQ